VANVGDRSVQSTNKKVIRFIFSIPSYCDGRTVSFTRFFTQAADQITTGVEYKTLKVESNSKQKHLLAESQVHPVVRLCTITASLADFCASDSSMW
jgi:hypothetical protein